MKIPRHSLACWAALAALSLGGCKKNATDSTQTTPGEGKPRHIAFVTNGVASFWNIAAAGAKAAGEELGVKTQTLMPSEGISDQKRIVEDLLTRGVHGIAISPMDSANQTELLNTAARRTKLITHDSDAPDSDRLLYVGMDNYKAGRMCGEMIREALPNGGSVMLFVGRLEQENARLRRQGLIDVLLGRAEDRARFDPPSNVLEGNGYKILGTLTDQFDRAQGKANVEDSLAKHPDLGCLVGLFAYNPPLILEALEQAQKLGKIQVVAFDEDDATLDAVEKGTVHGTVVQNPYLYGYKSVEILNALIDGKKAPGADGQFVDVPARKIRKADVAEFRADLKSKLQAVK
jgi:ribose transport system substrate-binding protein